MKKNGLDVISQQAFFNQSRSRNRFQTTITVIGLISYDPGARVFILINFLFSYSQSTILYSVSYGLILL